jgi:signal transduction histidine kinase
MPIASLERHFARRMLPVATLAAAVLGAVPPLSYRIVAWQKLETQARAYAAGIASGIRKAAERDPYLWRYNLPKVLQATSGHRGREDIGEVRVVDCVGGTLFTPERLGIGTGETSGPAGWAPVDLRGTSVAWVEVRTDPRNERATLARIAAGAAALGLTVGLFVYLLPVQVIRRRARDIAEAVGRIQEEERSRIGRDLHDSVGQALTALQIDLELARTRPDEAPERMHECVTTCEETLKDLRRVVQDLRPPELAASGLTEFLRTYTERFEMRTGIPVSFRASGGDVRSQQVATCLFRILQEALTNVSRHASASEVGVVLDVANGSVSMEVSDDGAGFDAAGAPRGSGLRGMKERCDFLGGTFAIASRPGAGTRVSVRLPQATAT